MRQKLKFCRILFIHDEKLVVENANYTVRRTVDLGDVLGFKRSLDNAVRAGVDNRSRSARLTENACPTNFPFIFAFFPSLKSLEIFLGFVKCAT